jgi:hypothetical protein
MKEDNTMGGDMDKSLGKYDFLCDKCGAVIIDGDLTPDNHITTEDGNTWCLDCVAWEIANKVK